MSFTHSSHSKGKTPEKNSSKPILDKSFDHVMCFGTFDIFHPGHVFYLNSAFKLAKKMTVVIARDERVKKIKWKSPRDTEDCRRENVTNTFREAHVVLWDIDDIFVPLKKHNPDILAFWYDQRVPEEKLLELFPGIKIVRIEWFETDTWKSSLLRKEESV
jgi:FAD synthetase